MKKKTRHNPDRPFGKITVVDDFLPSPHTFAKSFATQKITIDIETNILDFFKHHAEKSGGKYQRLIREVLKEYAKHYAKAS